MAVLVLHHQPRGLPPPRSSPVSSSFVFGVLGIGTILLFGIHLVAFVVWFPSSGTTPTILPNDPPTVVRLPQQRVPPPRNGIKNGTVTMKEKENVGDNDDVNHKFAEKSIALRSLLAAGIAEETLLQHYGELPTNAAIIDLYGPRPIVIGLEWCELYRQSVPAVQRTLGAAGMFSTGTNLVTQLLKRNCVIPERAAFYGEAATKEELGVRWQVRTFFVIHEDVVVCACVCAYCGRRMMRRNRCIHCRRIFSHQHFFITARFSLYIHIIPFNVDVGSYTSLSIQRGGNTHRPCFGSSTRLRSGPPP
jgi:hypothetical protein